MTAKPQSARTARRGEPSTGFPGAITFGRFRLDLSGARLLCDERPTPLRPKTWAVLLYLAERPGVLVTKNELLDTLWRDVAVTEDTLNKSIGELRLALGDRSQAPRFIETVHRRGFRFIAETRREVASKTARARAAVFGSAIAPPRPSHRPFVGRDEELERLATLLAKAQTGERQIAFITGPAGIGKTALVDAFLDSPAVREADEPLWIARAGCIDHHGPREAYMPVLEALDRLARRPGSARLLDLLRRIAPMWLAQMPWLLDETDMDELRRSLRGVSSERMLRELVTLIEALTADLTLVLVLEDLHWSDPSTVDVLSLLGQRRDPSRLLVIGTYRPADVAVSEHVLASAVRTLQAHRHCVDLPLHDLTEEALRTYLATRFPGGDFCDVLAPLIHSHTGGDPLFVVATVDHVLSRGWILETAPGWALSAPPETIELGVPEDVRRTIETELHRLSPGERDLLEAASVTGDEVSAPIVAAALDAEVGEVEMRCERLARTERFLRASGGARLPHVGAARPYAFTHELYRQVVYKEIAETRRARLHLRIGEALEAAHGDETQEIAPRLAVHFERGRDHARALRYLTIAGALARKRFGNREAIDYLESALAAAAQLPDGTERRRRELEVRLVLSGALNDRDGFAAERVRENCERAYDLCTEAGSSEQLFEILQALCHVHAVRADRDRAPAFAAKLDDLARSLGTPDHRMVADSLLIRTGVHRGQFAEACRIAEAGVVERLDSATDISLPVYGADPLIAGNNHYALALWFLGRVEQARTTIGRSLATASETGSPFTQAATVGLAAVIALLCREAARVRDLSDRLAELSTEQGFAYWSATASALRGWAHVQDGRTRQGIDQLENARAAYHAIGARVFSTYILAFLADAHRLDGNRTAGLAAADDGLAVAESTLDRSYWSELWRLKGELLLVAAAERRRPSRGKRAKSPTAADSHWPEAERCLLRGLEVARAAEAKSLELRAATSLARAWGARGRGAQARKLLGAVRKGFAAGDETADTVDASRLLDHLATAR